MRHRLGSWLSLLFLAILMAFAASCSSDEPTPPPSATEPKATPAVESGTFDDGSYYAGPSRLAADYNHLVPRTWVQPVTAAQAEAATTTPTSVQFPRAGNDDVLTWEKGRIIVSQPATGAGNKNAFGFARRVAAVTNDGQTITVTTETVGVEDLFSGDMQATFDGTSVPVDVSGMDKNWVAGNLYGVDSMTEFPVEELPDEADSVDPRALAPVDDPSNADSVTTQGFFRRIFRAVKRAVKAVVHVAVVAAQEVVHAVAELIPIPTSVSGSTTETVGASGKFQGAMFTVQRTQTFRKGTKTPFTVFMRGQGTLNNAETSFEPAVQMGVKVPLIPGAESPTGWMNVDAHASVDLDLALRVEAGLASGGDPNDHDLANDIREALLGPSVEPPGAWSKVLYVSKPRVKYFQAGPVPVVLTMTGQLNLECGFEVRGAVDSTLKIHADTSVMFGASVSGSSVTPNGPNFGLKHNYSTSHLASGSAMVFCGLVPRVNVFLYDAIGIYGAARTSLVGRASYDETCPTSYTKSTPDGEAKLSLAFNAGLRVGGRAQAPGSSFEGVAGAEGGKEAAIEFWNHEWPIKEWTYGNLRGIGYCTPLCRNGAKDERETDLDCGSVCSTGCAEGKSCAATADCQRGLSCVSGACTSNYCLSGARERDETDVDCGGTACGKCDLGKFCVADRDCQSGVCGRAARDLDNALMPPFSVCVDSHCVDHVKSADETGIDCGGSCPKCGDGVASTSAAGCASGVWDGTFCVKGNCRDHVKNGSESDVDCGGGTCDRCGVGQLCGSQADCQNGIFCNEGVCSTTAPPVLTVSAIGPNRGKLAGGTTVTISGLAFKAGASVTVGGSICTGAVVQSSTSITCTVPAGDPGPADVVVTLPNTESATGVGLYTYAGIPTVAGVSPNHGAALLTTPITVSGTNLATDDVVMIGANACTNVIATSATTLTCVVPSAPGTLGNVDVTVTDPFGQAAPTPGVFTYLPTPTVTGVTPNKGALAGGGVVNVTGTSFDVGSSVTIGGAPCTAVEFVSSTSLNCTAPAGSAGTVDVAVTSSGGVKGTGASLFTFVAPPTVTSVSPNTGNILGGFDAVLTGTGFASGDVVKFGNNTCTPLTVDSPTQITCRVPVSPNDTPVSVDVIVTDAYGQSATLPNAFAYVY